MKTIVWKSENGEMILTFELIEKSTGADCLSLVGIQKCENGEVRVPYQVNGISVSYIGITETERMQQYYHAPTGEVRTYSVYEQEPCAVSDLCGVMRLWLPSHLLKISEGAFSKCKKLEAVAIMGNCPRFRVIDSCLVDSQNFMLAAVTKEETLRIPDGVRAIKDFTATVCVNLKRVILPKSVSYVSDSMFYCIKELFYRGTREEWAHVNVFYGQPRAIYYYSEEKPDFEGLFWHEVDGVPVVW